MTTLKEKPVSKARQVEHYLDLFKKNDDEAVSARKRDYAALARFHYALGAELYEIAWGAVAPHVSFREGRGILRRDPAARALHLQPLGAGAWNAGPRCRLRGWGTHARDRSLLGSADRRGQHRPRGGRKNPALQRASGSLEAVRGNAGRLHGTCRQKMPPTTGSTRSDRLVTLPTGRRLSKSCFGVLKPDGLLVADECVMTDRYDPDDREHRRIKHDIELAYGIPDMITAAECRQSMAAAGFELLETNDRAQTGDPETPWYSPLEASGFSIRAMARSPIGRRVTNQALGILEALRPSARGSRRGERYLQHRCRCHRRGGKEGHLDDPVFHARPKARR